jgi:hypothetical protein
MSKRTLVAPESHRKPLTEFSVEEKNDPNPMDQETPQHKRALLKAELRQKFVTLADQVAQHTLYFRSYKYQGADKAYPDSIHALQRFVTKCYPYAKDGMLLVDEPKNEREAKLAFEKQKVLKKLGFRHIVICEFDATHPVTLYDLMEQLGEI